MSTTQDKFNKIQIKIQKMFSSDKSLEIEQNLNRYFMTVSRDSFDVPDLLRIERISSDINKKNMGIETNRLNFKTTLTIYFKK